MRHAVFSLSLLFSSLAFAESQPRLTWVDQDGKEVAADVIEVAIEACGVDDAANHIANLDGGDVEAALARYRAAVDCFDQQGFTAQQATPQRDE